MQSALRTGRLDAEWRVVRPGGEIVAVMARGIVEKAPGGQPLRLVGANVDMSSRMRAERLVREAAGRRAFLLALSDALGGATDPAECQAISTRMTGTHLAVARATFAEVSADGSMAVAADHADGLPSLAGVHGRGAGIVQSLLANMGRGGVFASPDVAADRRLCEADRQAVAADGVVALLATGLWRRGRCVALYLVHCTARRDWTAGERRILQDAAQRTHDAVERARLQKTLRDALDESRVLAGALSVERGRLAAVVRHLPVAVWIVGTDGRAAEANAEATRITGGPCPCAREEDGRVRLLDPRSGEPLPPGDDPVGRAMRTRETEGPVELDVRARDGDGGTVLFSAAPVLDDEGVFRGVVGIGLDITEHARLDAALRESEARFRTLVDVVPVLLWRADASGAQVQLNSRWRHYTGQPVEESQGAGWLDAIHPDDRDGTRRLLAAAVEAGTAAEVEYRLRGADGSYRWFLARQVPLTDEAGRLVSWFGAAVDVHDRHVATEALRASEERFRQFAEASHDVLWIRDARTLDYEYLSPAYEAVHGTSIEQATARGSGGRVVDVVVPQDRAAVREALSCARSGEHVTLEFRIRREPDGESRWLRSTIFPLFDASGRVRRVGGIARDVTEAQRHAAHLELMVAELRHRTRNLVAVTRSISERTLRESSSLEEYSQAFRTRLGALARVQSLLSRLAGDERVTFDEILRCELRALGLDGDARVDLDGPDGVLLRSGGLQILVLALHELMTNTVRRGALSVDCGALGVRWRLLDGDDAQRLLVEWMEHGADPSALRRPGYCTELVEKALPHQLGATTTFMREADGARWTIDLPVSSRMGGRPS